VCDTHFVVIDDRGEVISGEEVRFQQDGIRRQRGVCVAQGPKNEVRLWGGGARGQYRVLDTSLLERKRFDSRASSDSRSVGRRSFPRLVRAGQRPRMRGTDSVCHRSNSTLLVRGVHAFGLGDRDCRSICMRDRSVVGLFNQGGESIIIREDERRATFLRNDDTNPTAPTKSALLDPKMLHLKHTNLKVRSMGTNSAWAFNEVMNDRQRCQAKTKGLDIPKS